MSIAYRLAGSAPLGAPSAGEAEPALLVGLALHSTLSANRMTARLCSTLSALLQAEKVTLVEGSDPADPLFALLQEAFSRKEAVHAEAVHSMICAPLFSENHPEGALVAERPAGTPFGPRELKLLAAAAPMAAAAIRHARIYERATSDGLTGLPNRQRFTVELEDAATLGGTVSLILADLDHFKDKNEVYGRGVGDRALAEVGELLAGRLATASCVARTGDDEFGALITGTDAAHARDFAEDLRRLVNDRIFDERHEGIHLTLSAGVAELRRGEMASGLFTRAADALAAAKRGGRNRVELAK